MVVVAAVIESLVKAVAVGICAEMLLDVNVNVSADVVTALEFPMSLP